MNKDYEQGFREGFKTAKAQLINLLQKKGGNNVLGRFDNINNSANVVCGSNQVDDKKSNGAG